MAIIESHLINHIDRDYKLPKSAKVEAVHHQSHWEDKIEEIKVKGTLGEVIDKLPEDVLKIRIGEPGKHPITIFAGGELVEDFGNMGPQVEQRVRDVVVFSPIRPGDQIVEKKKAS